MEKLLENEEKLLTVKEVATLLGCSTAIVRIWCSKGILKAIKPAGKRWILESSLKAILEQKK